MLVLRIAEAHRLADRRAGRLPTEQTAAICARLRDIQFPDAGVEVFVEPVQDQRFVLVLRGDGLTDQVAEFTTFTGAGDAWAEPWLLIT